MADYQEKIIAFDSALDRQEIVPVGMPVESIYINGTIPGAVTLKIHGGARPGIVVASFASLELCPAETQGVSVSTAGVAPGSSLSVIIGTGVTVQGGA